MTRLLYGAILLGTLGLSSSAIAGRRRPPPPAAVPPPAPEPEPEPEVLTLPCTWAKDLELHYTHERRRTDAQKPALAQVRSLTPVVVSIVESNPRTTIFSYDTGTTELAGPPEVVAATAQAIAELDMPPMLLVMKAGTVVSVQNYLEIADATEPVLRATVPPDAPPGVLEQTMAMFRSPDLGPKLLLRDPGLLFSMHCAEVTPGQSQEFFTDMESPFGGEPITGIARIGSEDYDPSTGLITMYTEYRTDPEALQAMLPEVIDRFLPDSQEISPEQLADILAQLPPLESRTTSTARYSVADGFPVEIEVHREIGGADHPQQRTDTWIWRREPAAP